MTTLSIEAVNQAVRQAVSKDNESKGKWQAAGQAVAVFYMTAEKLEAVKAQFIADAILPAMDKKHAQALAVDLPRKGSKDYNELSQANQANWETANQAKKDARASSHTMFSRVVKYAFPTEKKESIATTTKTKLIELINDAIKKAQKDETPDYDATTLIAQLQLALATASK